MIAIATFVLALVVSCRATGEKLSMTIHQSGFHRYVHPVHISSFVFVVTSANPAEPCATTPTFCSRGARSHATSVWSRRFPLAPTWTPTSWTTWCARVSWSTTPAPGRTWRPLPTSRHRSSCTCTATRTRRTPSICRYTFATTWPATKGIQDSYKLQEHIRFIHSLPALRSLPASFALLLSRRSCI